MAQKISFSVTAKEITRPSGSKVQVPAAGIVVGILTDNAVFFPVGASSTDTRIIANDWEFVVAEDFADLLTAVSATAIQGS